MTTLADLYAGLGMQSPDAGYEEADADHKLSTGVMNKGAQWKAMVGNEKNGLDNNYSWAKYPDGHVEPLYKQQGESYYDETGNLVQSQPVYKTASELKAETGWDPNTAQKDAHGVPVPPQGYTSVQGLITNGPGGLNNVLGTAVLAAGAAGALSGIGAAGAGAADAGALGGVGGSGLTEAEMAALSADAAADVAGVGGGLSVGVGDSIAAGGIGGGVLGGVGGSGLTQAEMDALVAQAGQDVAGTGGGLSVGVGDSVATGGLTGAGDVLNSAGDVADAGDAGSGDGVESGDTGGDTTGDGDITGSGDGGSADGWDLPGDPATWTFADWTRLLGSFGPAILGAYGSNELGNSLHDIANQQHQDWETLRNDRLPFLNQGTQWLEHPNSYLRGPAAKGAINATLRGLSVTGNPFGSPFKMEMAGDAALRSWQNAWQGAGAIGTGTPMAPTPTAAMAGAQADVGGINAIGYGLGNYLNPQPTLQDWYNLSKNNQQPGPV